MLDDKETLKAKFLLWRTLNNITTDVRLCMYCKFGAVDDSIPNPRSEECFNLRNILWYKDKDIFDYEVEPNMHDICLAFLENDELYKAQK